jgi:putative ABC transport system permease protein
MTDCRIHLAPVGEAKASLTRILLTKPSAHDVVTTVLLILAGLLVASLGRVLGVQAGFDEHNALLASVDLPPQSYDKPAHRLRFYNEPLAGAQSLPGIRAVGWVSIPPLGGQGSVTAITVSGASQPKEEIPEANYRSVSPNYFAAMGIALVRGRIFGPADRGRQVVVLSENVAERFWPGQNPVGKVCVTHWGGDVPAEVIGVVSDIRTVQLDEASSGDYVEQPPSVPANRP